MLLRSSTLHCSRSPALLAVHAHDQIIFSRRCIVSRRTQQTRQTHHERAASPRIICCVAAEGTPATAQAEGGKGVLYVSKLAPGLKGDDLAEHFRSQEGFQSAFVMEVEDDDGGKEPMGYVQFASAEAATAAQKALNGSRLKDLTIKVQTEKGSGKGATAEATAAAADETPEADDKTDRRGPKPGPNVLFMLGLAEGTSKQQVRDHLSQVLGSESGLQQLRLVLKFRRRLDGYAVFDSEANAAAALQALQGSELNGSSLVVKIHEVSRKEQASAAEEGESDSSSSSSSSSNKRGDSRENSNTGGEKRKRDTGRAAGKARQAETFDLFVQNLAWATTTEGLREHFQDCEGFSTAFTVNDRDGRPGGRGYAKFTTAEAATAALEAKNGSELDGRQLNVFHAVQRSKAAAAADSTEGSDPGSSAGDGSSSDKSVSAWSLSVNNLSWQTTDEELKEFFSDCQGLLDAFITLNQDKRPSGKGFVRFDTEANMDAALKAKKNTELDGRSITLRRRRPGRVEGPTAAGSSTEDPFAGADPTETRLVLKGLPAAFGYREVLGMCSVFGQVEQVKRARSQDKSSASVTPAAEESEEALDAERKQAALEARKRMPAVVTMHDRSGAEAAVLGLNGRRVQGSIIVARMFRPPKANKQQEAQKSQDQAVTEEPQAA